MRNVWFAASLVVMLLAVGGCNKQTGALNSPSAVPEWKITPFQNGAPLKDLGLSEDCRGHVYKASSAVNLRIKLADGQPIPAGFDGKVVASVNGMMDIDASALLTGGYVDLGMFGPGTDYDVIVEAKIDGKIVATANAIIRTK